MSLFRPKKTVGIVLTFPTTYYSDVCYLAKKHNITIRNGVTDGSQSSLYVESQEDEHKLSIEICKEFELDISVPSQGWSEDWREFCNFMLKGIPESATVERRECPLPEEAPELEKGPERIVCS